MKTALRINLKHCSLAESEHKKSLRQYMHAGHHPFTICYAKAFWKLPPMHQFGLLAHEIGHVVLLDLAKIGDHSEPDADWEAEKILGVTVRYKLLSPYGEDLQYLDIVDAAKFAWRARLHRDKNEMLVIV